MRERERARDSARTALSERDRNALSGAPGTSPSMLERTSARVYKIGELNEKETELGNQPGRKQNCLPAQETPCPRETERLCQRERARERERERPCQRDRASISHKVFTKSFCRSQLPHKIHNLSLFITNMKNELTDLCGN